MGLHDRSAWGTTMAFQSLQTWLRRPKQGPSRDRKLYIDAKLKKRSNAIRMLFQSKYGRCQICLDLSKYASGRIGSYLPLIKTFLERPLPPPEYAFNFELNSDNFWKPDPEGSVPDVINPFYIYSLHLFGPPGHLPNFLIPLVLSHTSLIYHSGIFKPLSISI